MPANSSSSSDDISRRKVIATGAAAVAAGVFAGFGDSAVSKSKRKRKGKDNDNDGNGTPQSFEPFTQPMAVPPVKQELSIGAPPFTPGDVFHGIVPEFYDRSIAEDPSLNWYEAHPTKWYEMEIRETTHEIIPGVQTPVFGYDGMYPGPTFKSRVGQPMVVRTRNMTGTEMSVHLHGGHNPAHSDGYPNFFVLPGRARDYFYTNTVPLEGGIPDFGESPSTMWYHDHAMDITAFNVWAGLAGFFLTFNDIEMGLINNNVIPDDPYDIPIVVQDRRLNADGTLFFDPLDHNGTLGDLTSVGIPAATLIEFRDVPRISSRTSCRMR